MRINLKPKYFLVFIISFIPIFILVNFVIYSYMEERFLNEKWNSLATLAENSALSTEEFLVQDNLDLLSLQQILTNIKKNEGVMEAFILSNRDELIAHHDIDFLQKKDTIDIKFKRKNMKIKREYSTIFEKDIKYYAVAPIFKKNTENIIGRLYISFSKRNIKNLLNKILFRTIGISIAGLFLISITIVIMVNFIVKPIKKLHKGVEEIANGNYETYINKTTKDEIGDLTTAFNTMAKNLKEKELVRNMFSKYLSPDIAEYILENPEQLELGGIESELTIMFLDIRGFTALSENFHPNDIVKFLNSFFTSMVDIIFSHKGTLDKFLGDGLLAIFGAPVKYEGHAKKAVEAAIKMVEHIKKYNKDRRSWGKEEMHIGIGINTGKAIIGNIGSKQRAEYTVIGDTVNTCSRIEGLTSKEEILISQKTYDLIKDDFECEFVGEKKVKNKKYPIKIYKVLT